MAHAVWVIVFIIIVVLTVIIGAGVEMPGIAALSRALGGTIDQTAKDQGIDLPDLSGGPELTIKALDVPTYVNPLSGEVETRHKLELRWHEGEEGVVTGYEIHVEYSPWFVNEHDADWVTLTPQMLYRYGEADAEEYNTCKIGSVLPDRRITQCEFMLSVRGEQLGIEDPFDELPDNPNQMVYSAGMFRITLQMRDIDGPIERKTYLRDYYYYDTVYLENYNARIPGCDGNRACVDLINAGNGGIEENEECFDCDVVECKGRLIGDAIHDAVNNEGGNPACNAAREEIADILKELHFGGVSTLINRDDTYTHITGSGNCRIDLTE
ncbi:hypothetical protein JXB11_05015, partial [Candidatus Woesearchaeota archaeon]|nr:hypothetical protein [Candidatus Woesearchaeota archaeon]